MENGGEVIGVIIVLVFFALWCIYLINTRIIPEADKKRMEKLKDIAKYNESGSCLDVYERSTRLRSAFTISADRNITFAETPDKYIYRSATVGGVTTGGIEKQEGYSYVADASKTGKYSLYYNGRHVKKIYLTKKLLEEAKASAVSKYLNGNFIQVVEDVAWTDTAVKLMENGNLKMGIDAQMRASKAGFPTYEKCVEIKEWLCIESDY